MEYSIKTGELNDETEKKKEFQNQKRKSNRTFV